MASKLSSIDPVQGLIDFTNDIKPYHSKIVEILIEYVGQEFIDATVFEDYSWEIELIYEHDNIFPCSDGYSSSGFGSDGIFTIASPEPNKTISSFPSITNDYIILLGKHAQVFDSTNNLTFKIYSFYEDKILDTIPTNGSPLTGGFYVKGDQRSTYRAGKIITVITYENEKINYILTNDGTYDPITDLTTITIDGQEIPERYEGIIRVADLTNTGSFGVINSEEYNVDTCPYKN